MATDTLIGAYRAAGFDPHVSDDDLAVIAEAEGRPIEEIVWRRFAKTAPLYPRCRWEDPERQIGDLRAVLEASGLSVDLDAADLHGLDWAAMTDRLVERANEALARRGDDRRFFRIAGCPDPDPVARWLLATESQIATLTQRGVITTTAAARGDVRGSFAPARVSLGRRLGAKLFDMVACGIAVTGFAFILGPWGGIAVGYGWFLASDWAGSLGKSMFKLKVVDFETGRPCRLLPSVLRNLPFVVTVLPRHVSKMVLGAPLPPSLVYVLATIGLAIALAEVLKAAAGPEGRRFGDLLAGTVVTPQ